MKREFVFPFKVTRDEVRNASISAGLTKREYFAGLAMQGLIANGSHNSGLVCDPDWTHEKAISLADALIKELEKSDG